MTNTIQQSYFRLGNLFSNINVIADLDLKIAHITISIEVCSRQLICNTPTSFAQNHIQQPSSDDAVPFNDVNEEINNVVSIFDYFLKILIKKRIRLSKEQSNEAIAIIGSIILNRNVYTDVLIICS